MRTTAVEREAFVRAWQGAASVAEVARALQISEASARSRAARYRRRGVALRRFRGGPERVDARALDALARKHAPKVTR